MKFKENISNLWDWKKKQHHGLTFIPTNTFNKKETHTHTPK